MMVMSKDPSPETLKRAAKLIKIIGPMLEAETDDDTVAVSLSAFCMAYLVRLTNKGHDEHPMDVMEAITDVALKSYVSFLQEGTMRR